MNPTEREILKQKICKRHALYTFQHSRLQRLLRDPWTTIPYFILQAIAYRHPFKVTKKTLWGASMTYFLPEGNAIYYYGFFEANLTNFFINVLQEGDVFLDVGAHVGFYSVLGSSLVGSTGSVHSFEPTPLTFSTLRENTKHLPNVTITNSAVLNEKKFIEFVDYGPKYSAFNSFKARANKDLAFLKQPHVISVPTVSLDEYCATNKLIPSLIKIDAEGAEFLILQAMSTILSTIKPIVTIEVAGDEEWKENCANSINLLTTQGFECYEVTLEGCLRHHILKDSYGYENLVFVHPDTREKVSHLIL